MWCLSIQLEACLARNHLCSYFAYVWRYFQGLFGFIMDKWKEKYKAIFTRSRRCRPWCFTKKPPHVVLAGEASKGLKSQGEGGSKKQSAFPSQSSIPNSTHNLDDDRRGLLLWNQTRKQWVGDEGSKKPKEAQESKIRWNDTYQSLLGSNRPFPQPIPLPEMVDFLVDIWEQEGLYD